MFLKYLQYLWWWCCLVLRWSSTNGRNRERSRDWTLAGRGYTSHFPSFPHRDMEGEWGRKWLLQNKSYIPILCGWKTAVYHQNDVTIYINQNSPGLRNKMMTKEASLLRFTLLWTLCTIRYHTVQVSSVQESKFCWVILHWNPCHRDSNTDQPLATLGHMSIIAFYFYF